MEKVTEHQAVFIVMFYNQIVKAYSNLEDAETFVKGLVNKNPIEAKFSILICAVPVENCFDPNWSILKENNYMGNDGYSIVDYQQGYKEV